MARSFGPYSDCTPCIATDLADTLVLTALMFTRHGHMVRRLSDVNDNAVYWDFVVVSWLPIYALIYWFPRVVG
jgi:cytochrome c oxidase subunit III